MEDVSIIRFRGKDYQEFKRLSEEFAREWFEHIDEDISLDEFLERSFQYEKRPLLNTEKGRTYIAWLGNEAIGYIMGKITSAYPNPEYKMEINPVFVYPKHRCRGVARNLIARIQGDAKQTPQINNLCGYVQDWNENLQKLLLKLGFEEKKDDGFSYFFMDVKN